MLREQLDPPEEPSSIEATFRNGSLTAISVVVGFSLTFLNRWAALPGTWTKSDLAAVLAIVVGIAFQIASLSSLLSPRSLLLRNYIRAVRAFLVGLGLVAIGVAVAIASDLLGHGQQVLGG
jgi:hypothetical protein